MGKPRRPKHKWLKEIWKIRLQDVATCCKMFLCFCLLFLCLHIFFKRQHIIFFPPVVLDFGNMVLVSHGHALDRWTSEFRIQNVVYTKRVNLVTREHVTFVSKRSK